MGFFSGKKLLIVGAIAILLIAIPLTVYLAQKQQETQSHAAKSTTLSISPATTSTSVGQTFSVDVMMDPGQNLVSFVKLKLTYDATKLTPTTNPANASCTNSFCPNNTAFPAVLEGPTATNGAITISLSVGADPTKVIQAPTKVATITFSAIGPTSPGTSDIAFDTSGNNTQVLSIASSDQPSENVLSTTSKGTVTVAAGANTSPTPTPTPTSAPSGPAGTNQAPICTAFNIDRSASGPAPYSITFTATGNDPDGTINKVTFNFGDGASQDLLQTGGIGTRSVSAQMAHTYNNPGTFTASTVLTDNSNAVSVPGTCTQTITILQATQSAQTTTIAVASTPTPLPPTPTALPRKTFGPPGPGDTILKVGAVGFVLSAIGGLLFLAL